MPATERFAIRGLLVQRSHVTSEILDALPRLQAVGKIGRGTDGIDVEAATRRRIAIVNSGDHATEEIAIHAVTMMLNLIRGLPYLARTMREGGWPAPSDLTGLPRLSQLRLGLVGLGPVGTRVAAIASALGLKVMAHAPSSRCSPVELANTLDDLLTTVDLLSLHTSNIGQSRYMIGERELLLMPRGSIFINVERASLVDEDALLWCIEAGHLAGAGLDVFETEPLPPGHPLRKHDNIILTPHMAYYSEPALTDARRQPVEGIAAVFAGKRPANQVNDTRTKL
jgi:D-3-phosphoglycerate dehydrogenase